LLVGGAALQLLPVARIEAAEESRAPAPDETGDPTKCEYWRYCAIHGYLCACCGGAANVCPPGTEMSPITWIGTCRNPVDHKEYAFERPDACREQPTATSTPGAPAIRRSTTRFTVRDAIRPEASDSRAPSLSSRIRLRGSLPCPAGASTSHAYRVWRSRSST